MVENNSTMVKIPGNVNTIYIVVSTIVVLAGVYYGLDEVKRQVGDLRLGATSTGEQLQRINVSIGQHDIEIKNLEEEMIELRRQANGGRDPSHEFRSVNPTAGGSPR